MSLSPDERLRAVRIATTFLETTWHCDRCRNRHPNDMRDGDAAHDRICHIPRLELLCQALVEMAADLLKPREATDV